jgi:diguanylate cyclase (GGDEF)-like protein/PAS domain S-box-containing protein
LQVFTGISLYGRPIAGGSIALAPAAAHPPATLMMPQQKVQVADAEPTLSVLVVEDNAADAMVAQAAVAKAGHGRSRVQRAESLAQALARLAAGEVHLVLLDLNLPDSRGLDTLRRVRVATRSPIIVVTAEDRPGLDDEALEEGAFEILHKGNLGTDSIARLLRLAAGQRRTQERLEAAERAARDELRASETRFRSLTELSSDWYWEQDAQLRFTYLSPGFTERSGGDPARVLGRRRWDFEDVVPAAGTWEDHRAMLESHQPFGEFEQIHVTADGTRVFIASSGVPIFNEAGAFIGYRGVGRNVTARRNSERMMERLARFDAATGLPNRNLVHERIQQAIAAARRRDSGVGVLLLDLDRFKLVNDTLGHQRGDALLAQVGLSLKDCVRREDTVGRMGGDEFAVVLGELPRPDDAALVARKILDSFGAPFDLEGQEAFITASIGVATFPQDGDDADTLLQRADAAMYRAKESSRNAYCFYTSEMNERAAAKLQLNSDLRRAVERAEFELNYQPKVRLDTGALVGMEALLRWRHPERGMVAPNDFVPALEDTGLIMGVGDWVVAEACRQLRRWIDAGLAPLPIAVNLSVKQFRRRDLDAAIDRQLSAYGLARGLLELEVTESSLMEDPRDAVRQLRTLRDAGLSISADDFGTGYSSLAYLTRLPLSALKIDRGFVNDALRDPQSAAIVRMVIDMARRLNMDVVADGIETEAHAEFLRQQGCELGQGYLYGRPVPAADIAARLKAK